MEHSLTIKDLSNEQVILQDQDSNLIYWPRDKAPNDIKVGDILNFSIGANQNIAKDILNEIFNKD